MRRADDRPHAVAARLTRVVVIALGVLLAQAVPAQDVKLAAPNVVVIDATLVTSGQPTAAALRGLAQAGFGAVISLAPENAADAVADEARIVESQGIAFVRIPIPFGAPEAAHYQAFAGALTGFAGRKVLVHCQVNMRASTMVFLYRTIVRHEPPASAYDAVAKVWSPQGPWRQLIVEQLHQNDIAFDPY